MRRFRLAIQASGLAGPGSLPWLTSMVSCRPHTTMAAAHGEVSRAVPYAVRQHRAVPAGGDDRPSGRNATSPFEDLMVWTSGTPDREHQRRPGRGDSVGSPQGRHVPDPGSHSRPAQRTRRARTASSRLPRPARRGARPRRWSCPSALPSLVPRNLPPADLTLLLRAVIMDPLAQLRMARRKYAHAPVRSRPLRLAAVPVGGRFAAPARKWVSGNTADASVDRPPAPRAG